MTKIEGANMSKPHTRCRLGKKRGHKGVWAGPLAIGRRAVQWFHCTARTAQRSRSGALALMVPPNGESLKIYVRSRRSVSIRAMRSGRQFIGCEFCARVASSSSTRVSRRIVQVGPPSADADHNPHPSQTAAGAIARSVRARATGTLSPTSTEKSAPNSRRTAVESLERQSVAGAESLHREHLNFPNNPR
jgi:hypothetical protein